MRRAMTGWKYQTARQFHLRRNLLQTLFLLPSRLMHHPGQTLQSFLLLHQLDHPAILLTMSGIFSTVVPRLMGQKPFVDVASK